MASTARTDLEPTESLYFAIDDGGLIASKLRARRLASHTQESLIVDSAKLSTENTELNTNHAAVLSPSLTSPTEPQDELKATEIKPPTTLPPTPKIPLEVDTTISALDTVAPYAADRHSTNTIDVVGDFIADLSDKPNPSDSPKGQAKYPLAHDEQNEQQIILINGDLPSKLHARRAATASTPVAKAAPPTRRFH